MRLNKRYRRRLHSGHSQRLGHGGGLSINTGRQVTDLTSAIIVYGRAKNNGVNTVSLSKCILQRPQNHHTNATSKHGAGRSRIERPAVTIAGRSEEHTSELQSRL